MGWLAGWSSPALLKRLGAGLFLLGLLLPLYSCRGRFVDAAGREVKFVDHRGAVVPEETLDLRQPLPSGVFRLEPSMKPPPGLRSLKNYHYFFTDFSAGDWGDWLRLGGFLWPMGAAFFAERLRRRWSRLLFRLAEPFLLLVSVFSLAIGAMFGTQEIGFWVAWPGIVLYGLGAAWSDVVDLQTWRPALGRLGKLLLVMLVYGVFLASTVVSMMTFFDWFVK